MQMSTNVYHQNMAVVAIEGTALILQAAILVPVPQDSLVMEANVSVCRNLTNTPRNA